MRSMGILLAVLFVLLTGAGLGFAMRHHISNEPVRHFSPRPWKKFVRKNRELRDHLIRISKYYDE